MLCRFEYNQDHSAIVCSRCGRIVENYAREIPPERHIGKCKVDDPEPSLVQKAKRYSKAVTRWIAAGRPTRTVEEIERIFAICQDCPHYSDIGRPRCKLCGCSVNNLPDGLRNKIAMSTEACPDQPPRWLAE